MTDPTEAPESTQPDVTLHDVDLVLQVLAKTAQDNPFEIGLTLTVRGAVLTGTLVGRDTWFRELAAWLESRVEGYGDLASSIGEALTQLAPGGTSSAEHYAYLHLKDARVLSGHLLPTLDGLFWRGRISEISGFAIGTLNAA